MLFIGIASLPNLSLQAELVETIRDFRQLRELELVAAYPRSANNALLSSITSIELRKVTFLGNYTRDLSMFGLVMQEWTSFDEQLCRLVDRLRTVGYRHILEVELRPTDIWCHPEKCDFTKFLPKFREKGVVTIIDGAHDGRVHHSSTHHRYR